MVPLSYLLVGHLIGDYLLQNDWMSSNKKKHTIHCAIHCIFYTFAIYAVSLGTLPVWAISVVFVNHFIQDRTNVINWIMDHKGQKSFRENLGPWSIIMVDNTYHVFTLFIIHAIITNF